MPAAIVQALAESLVGEPAEVAAVAANPTEGGLRGKLEDPNSLDYVYSEPTLADDSLRNGEPRLPVSIVPEFEGGDVLGRFVNEWNTTLDQSLSSATRTNSTGSRDSVCNIESTMRALSFEEPPPSSLASPDVQAAGSIFTLPWGREDGLPAQLSPDTAGGTRYLAHTAERPNWAVAPDDTKDPNPRNGYKRNMKSSIAYLPGPRNLHPRRGQDQDRASSQVFGYRQDGRPAMDWPSRTFRPLEHAPKHLDLLPSGPLTTQTGSHPSQTTSIVWTDPLTVSSSSSGMETDGAFRSPVPIYHLENEIPTFAFVGQYGDSGRGQLSGGQRAVAPASRRTGHSAAAVPVIVSPSFSDPRYNHYATPLHLSLRAAAANRPVSGRPNSARTSAAGSQWQLEYASDIIRSNSVSANQPRSGSFGALDPPVRPHGNGKPHTSQGPYVPYSRDRPTQTMQCKQSQTSRGQDVNRGVSHEYTNRFPTVREVFPNMSYGSGVPQSDLGRTIHEESALQFPPSSAFASQSVDIDVQRNTLWRESSTRRSPLHAGP